MDCTSVHQKTIQNGHYAEKTFVNIISNILIIAMFIITISCTYVSYSDYCLLYERKLEDKQSAIFFIERNCYDTTYMLKSGTVTECAKRQDIFKQSPREEAIRSYIASWGYCGVDGCEDRYKRNISLSDLIRSIILVIAILLIVIGLLIIVCLNNPNRKQYLPTNNIDAKNLEKKIK